MKSPWESVGSCMGKSGGICGWILGYSEEGFVGKLRNCCSCYQEMSSTTTFWDVWYVYIFIQLLNVLITAIILMPIANSCVNCCLSGHSRSGYLSEKTNSLLESNTGHTIPTPMTHVWPRLYKWYRRHNGITCIPWERETRHCLSVLSPINHLILLMWNKQCEFTSRCVQ